jgi:hypothetical protein
MAAALPMLLVLFGGFGGIIWMMWAQTVADIAAVRALRAASFNRGINLVSPGSGYEFFGESTSYLAGGNTASTLGQPAIVTDGIFRMVRLSVRGSTSWSFGPLIGQYSFGGGGAGRYWIFYPGPPAPWE